MQNKQHMLIVLSVNTIFIFVQTKWVYCSSWQNTKHLSQ